MQPLKINVGGIKCDNKECNFKDMSVPFSDYNKWLNKPCPKCGDNLLTEQDYFAVKAMVDITAIINEGLPEVKNDEPMYKMTVDFHGNGKATFSDIWPVPKRKYGRNK